MMTHARRTKGKPGAEVRAEELAVEPLSVENVVSSEELETHP
jgi:hypothetical protein